jgi:Uma2 family endonuclease
MTDEAFAQLCAEHTDLNLELSAEGELIITPQTYTWTGARNNEISAQLRNWARQDKRGVAFDSSTGWLLPNGARRSPDAAWILKDRIKDIDPTAFSRYWQSAQISLLSCDPSRTGSVCFGKRWASGWPTVRNSDG